MWSIHNVSIIIPVLAWKPEQVQMLDRCLNSITGQCGEAIVWSDGSSDDLAILFRALERKYGWVRFVFAGHNGKCVSRNNAANMATREILLPTDADDELMPDAVKIFLSEWDGETPLYSDIIRVHDGGVEDVRVLQDFSCAGIKQQCITPVNVFHLKSQWDFVGGWNKEINLLEDWEYNFRLLWQFGAKKIHRPLVKYHLHPDQHTARAKREYKVQATRWVQAKINEHARRNTMGCCGKRRTTSVKPTATTTPAQPLTSIQSVRSVDLSVTAAASDLGGDPGPGRVWAKYFGGRGMGPHNRRGRSTRTVYTRVTYGGVYAVKAADAVTADQFRAGNTGSEFVRMEVSRPQPPAPAPAPAAPKPAAPAPVQTQSSSRPEVRRSPVKVDRQPLDNEKMADYLQSMESMTLKELKSLLDNVEFGPDEINAFLAAEKAGKSRLGAIKLLEKQLSNF